MRLLLSCLQSPKRHAVPAYEFWRSYFVEGCREAQIDLIEIPDLDWVEGLVYPPGAKLQAWLERTWETVLSFARREHARKPIDFFLGYLYPKQVEPAAIGDLQRLGIPCVNFFCDNVREFWRIPEVYRPFALHWVPEYEALPLYRRAGLPHLHAPMPCWVPPELRSVPEAETEPPTFIGSTDLLRRDLVGRALHAGADFVVRGPGWTSSAEGATMPQGPVRATAEMLANQWGVVRAQGFIALFRKLENCLHPLDPPPLPAARVRSAVFGHEYFRVTREAMVTIGVNRVPTARASNRHPLTYSRLRDLEAPMLGACYLTEWTAGLGSLYEVGVEIETYKTPEELVAKVDELKGDRVRRRALRERGQRRALSDHCVARSLKRIAAHVTGNPAL
jgi:hypothetical protein